MSEYRIKQDGQTVEVWDDTNGVGICFEQGEILQGYNYAIYLDNKELLNSEEGMAVISTVSKKLAGYASGLYPDEFRELNFDNAKELTDD